MLSVVRSKTALNKYICKEVVIWWFRVNRLGKLKSFKKQLEKATFPVKMAGECHVVEMVFEKLLKKQNYPLKRGKKAERPQIVKPTPPVVRVPAHLSELQRCSCQQPNRCAEETALSAEKNVATRKIGIHASRSQNACLSQWAKTRLTPAS